MPIAQNARVWSISTFIAVYKSFLNIRTEGKLCIKSIERDRQPFCNGNGICDILITLTKEHGSANTFKTFLHSKISSDGTIHTAAHCNQRFGTGIHAIPPY